MARALQITSRCAEDTERAGRELSKLLKEGHIVGFSGELGAGKTVMIRGICAGLEVKERVTSSSFVIMRPLTGRLPVFHFDLYRLGGVDELADLGYEEYLYSDGISLIEWCEKLGDFDAPAYLRVNLAYHDEEPDGRIIAVRSAGRLQDPLIEELYSNLDDMNVLLTGE